MRSRSCWKRARQLANLIVYMDGKAGAEDLIEKILNDPALLQTLATQPAEPTSTPGKTQE